jgi:predicted Zn-dependent protease
MRTRIAVIGLIALVAAPPLAHAQLGGLSGALSKAKQVKDTIDDLTFSDAEERQLGAHISEMLRTKYGVAQDPAVHKYVALEGAVLAQASSRPSIGWTFIVLDTDGVNAFAAPGGFVHITRGALALIENESELAGVLGHEIAHVTEKHTINAIKKNKLVSVGASASRVSILESFANKAYELLLENGYDRKDEMGADAVGLQLANKVGYAPAGLGAFLARLSDRNKDLKDRSGLFASHPEAQARLDALGKLAGQQKPAGPATVAARYHQSITYKPVPVGQVATGSAPASSESKPTASKSGLGKLNPLGQEKSSTQTVSSAGSRGVNPDRDAKGGSNPALVTVSVTSAEVDTFRKGIV